MSDHSLRLHGRFGFLVRALFLPWQPQGATTPVQIRRVEGLRGSGAGKPRCSSRGRPGCRGTWWGRHKGAKYRFHLQFLTWFPRHRKM